MSFIFDSNNSYIFNIDEFTDNDRIHSKRIKATVKSKTNLDISSFVDINVVAPAIRSTEKEGEIQHKFLKTSDGQFLSLKEG